MRASTEDLSPQQRRRHERTRDILRRAESILITEGPEALTVQRLAAELDYTPGALYRYFASKDAILLGVQGLAVAAFADTFGRARALVDGLPQPSAAHDLAQLVAVFGAYAALAREWPARFALLANAITDPRQLVSDNDSPHILPPFLELLQHLVTPLHDAQQRGALRADGDPLDRAVALATALMGVLALRKVQRLNPRLLDPERLARLTFDGLLLGWGCTPEALAQAHAALADTDFRALVHTYSEE